MVSGIQFVESILFWVGMTLLFFGFVSACMESRHTEDVDHARTWVALKFDQLARVPLNLLLVSTLRFLRNSIDRVVRHLLTDMDVSSFSAPIIMAVLTMLLPIAAAINAFVGGSPLLLSLYASIIIAIFIMGLMQSNRGSTIILGGISILSTFGWLVLAPVYAVHSLTDHILKGTFSHAVLASVFVAVILYAGCCGIWLFYRFFRHADHLTHIDRFVARFLCAVPVMYLFFWLGLLAGHIAINDPSPSREWTALLFVVMLGAFSFSLSMATLEWGVRDNHRGHGLAVMIAVFVVALAGTIAIHGLITQELPFWLRFWNPSFSVGDISLGSSFWISHTPLFLWGAMLIGFLFVCIARVLVMVWPDGHTAATKRPFLAFSGASVGCAIVMFILSEIVDVYVNVN